MDVYAWVIFLYVAGTLVVGWFLLHEATPIGRKKDRLVGPTYWGFYNGSETESRKTIELKDLNAEDNLEELRGYASGQTVGSGRV